MTSLISNRHAGTSASGAVSQSTSLTSSRTGLGVLDRVKKRCRIAFVFTSGMTIMILGSLTMLAVALLTLFRARRLYADVIAKRMGRIGLWMAGIRVVVHHDEPLPQTQAVYISNHTSTLDLFVLISLGLPNARFFLSGFLRKILPLGLIGYLVGIIWTVPQRFPAKRVKIFQRAERILRRTGESVYLSPEGARITTGKIGHFNKGAFHLATNLGAPIVPFFIDVPKEIDPGMGLDIRPGVVDVYFKPAIPTHHWNIEDLEKNRTKVRDFFVQLHQEIRGS